MVAVRAELSHPSAFSAGPTEGAVSRATQFLRRAPLSSSDHLPLPREGFCVPPNPDRRRHKPPCPTSAPEIPIRYWPTDRSAQRGSEGNVGAHVLCDLRLCNSLALIEGDEDYVRNFEGPDFRHDCVANCQLRQNVAAIGCVLCRIARKTDRKSV